MVDVIRLDDTIQVSASLTKETFTGVARHETIL